jgi:hypothetical protein
VVVFIIFVLFLLEGVSMLLLVFRWGRGILGVWRSLVSVVGSGSDTWVILSLFKRSFVWKVCIFEASGLL